MEGDRRSDLELVFFLGDIEEAIAASWMRSIPGLEPRGNQHRQVTPQAFHGVRQLSF